jgi:hypothetical protein
MYIAALLVLFLVTVPDLGRAAPILPVISVVDISGFTVDERFTAVCLEGIANRTGPHVFLDTGSSLRWMQVDFGDSSNPSANPVWAAQMKKEYSSIGDYWIAELTRRRLFHFQQMTLGDLISKTRPLLKGRIRYQTVDDDLCIAATMSGLKDAVPMTDVVYTKFVHGGDLPTVFDISSLYSQFNPLQSNRISEHQWMINTLIGECGTDGAISRNKTYGLDMHDTMVDIDLGVEHRWAAYDLSYLSNATKNPDDKPDALYGFDLPDKQLIDTILKRLRPFSPVIGWGGPDENNTVRRITMDKAVLICGGAGNGSFFEHLPLLTKKPSRQLPAAKEALTNLIYVVFMVNEGDTLKYASNLQSLTWAEPERGEIPINWGMDPLLCERFPGLMSYYTSTSTPNDYFFAATSGWGYTHPDNLPPDSVEQYAQLVKSGSKRAGTPYLDVWWDGGLRSNGQFYSFFQQTGAAGITQWSDHQGVEYSPIDGAPIVYSNYYYTLTSDGPQKFANRLIQDEAGVKPPWFVVVYGGSPFQFAEVARRLPATFKVVRLDAFFDLVQQARPLIEGRTWKPGS